MWRRDATRGNRDSDQSLSDDSDEGFERVTHNNSCSEQLRSLYSRGKNKVPTTSHVEVQKEREMPPVSVDSVLDLEDTAKKFEGLSEDDVERETSQDEGREYIDHHHGNVTHRETVEEPIFDEDDATCLGLSLISGAEKFQKKHLQSLDSDRGTWCAVAEEAQELACLHYKPHFAYSISTNPDKRMRKGSKSKLKHKFSITVHSQNKDPSLINAVKVESEELASAIGRPPRGQYCIHGTREHSMAELFELLQHKNAKQDANQLSKTVADDGCAKHSVPELLEELQEASSGLRGDSTVKGYESKNESAKKRILPSLGNRFFDSKDNLELQINETSSDDEDVDKQQLGHFTEDMKGRTMADLFQQVFTTSAVVSQSSPFMPAGVGYYARLQQIMQREKDSHMEFLSQHNMTVLAREKYKCIDVKILSRSLEAKLIVCHCMLSENIEDFKNEKISERFISETSLQKIIIFQPNLCHNVELEVGNVVRVHSPWKEIIIGEDEVVIMCRYFSDVFS